MLLTGSCLLSLSVLATSLRSEGRDNVLSLRSDSRSGYAYSGSISHLLPREAQFYGRSLVADSAYNGHISRRNAESNVDADSMLGFIQIYARQPGRKNFGNAGSAGSHIKSVSKDKKAANNGESPGKSPTSKGSPEIDQAVKATAATLKEKFNWPPPNYKTMTPQERRVAAGKARTRQKSDNTEFFENRVAKFEELSKPNASSSKVGSKDSPKHSSKGSPKNSSPGRLPVSSDSSSQSAFSLSSKSGAAIKGSEPGKLSRQNSGTSSGRSSGVLVNTPDLLSPAQSTVDGGWTILDQ